MDSTSPSCEEAAYRKRRRSYSAAISEENSLDEDDDDEPEEEEESYPHRDNATRASCCRRRECSTRKISNPESESGWSTESIISKRMRCSSGDIAKSWSEIEIPELLLAHPEILSRMMQCRCFVPQFSACRCRCAQCQYHTQRRKISSTSSCFAKEPALLLQGGVGAKRKDSGNSVSTCQSFLPPSSGRNSAGSLYHCCNDVGDNGTMTTTIQRRHSIAAGPIPYRRYLDQMHSLRNCKIDRADNRQLSEQSLVGDTIRNCESITTSIAEPITASKTHPRASLKTTTTRATQSLATFHGNNSVPADIKTSKNNESRIASKSFARLSTSGKNAEAHDNAAFTARKNSAIPITPKMMRRRFSEQLILEGGLGSAGDSENLVDQAEDVDDSLTAINARKKITLKKHYYPEGGWGCVIVIVTILVHIISHGLQLASGLLISPTMVQFQQTIENAGWLGAMSTGVALLVSPVTIAFCRRKSTRVTAVLGGLVTALGCLFTSFASQFHQLFFSYGTVVGIGVGMTRDCSTLMVAQYFKRKRELVEIFIVSGSGLGIAVMSAFIKGAITKIGWRLGLQAVTGVVFLTFILGTFYRSASLYHPQRRAILHLKNQKRKIKDKNKADDRPPFFDFSTLKSKTVRILLVSTGISAFGINTPIFYLAHQVEEEGLGDAVVLLQAYLGLAWTVGCVAFGLLVVHRSVECRIARQYLTQAAVFVCGLCILALTAVQGNYHGYVMFAWIYGIFCGGYHYSLKMYTYERVRARNFARTWGFVQCSQAIPIAIGVPISGYINVGCGGKAGYYFSSTCVLVGSFTLFFIDLHRRNLSKHKHKVNGTKHTCASDNCPQRRKPSFSQEPENEGPHVAAAGAAGATAAAVVLGADIVPIQGEAIDVLGTNKPELTCISEEGIADMDLPDNLLEDLDYIGDCITSCNKVENYLMLSEFENNLIAEMPIIMDRRGRRWSLARSKTSQSNCGQTSGVQSTADEEEVKSKWRFTNVPPNANRMITVIDEASA
ncbi:uncharacterized protein [Anoplolepis gracilipes]|uniref:uncharacterized protein isoform X2 n=1 Tax=Anoplolepis gracilipes TaxID=354296 RepID=UPI003B9F34DA